MGASEHITFVKIHSFYRIFFFFSKFYWGQLSNLNPSTDRGRPPIPSIRFPQVKSGTSSMCRRSAFGLSFAHKKVT